MKPASFLCFALIGLAGCGHSVQTTSGADYLRGYEAPSPHYAARAPEEPVTASTSPTETDLIRAAASVEPLLTFPARFGLARLDNGRLSAVPADEADLWAEFAARHAGYGSFVPVNPIIAEFTSATVGGAENATTKIRLGAARQHLDAVLIYEVGLSSRNDNTALAFADLTILGGAILPTRDLEASGVANALLLDVRNGYPYGTASSRTDLTELSTSWGSDAREDELRKRARHEAVMDLLPEVEAMFAELAAQLAERRSGS